jgi:hypothetical protein
MFLKMSNLHQKEAVRHVPQGNCHNLLSDSQLFFFFWVSVVTVSSAWGQGSNWPIRSKLHFSEWFPLSWLLKLSSGHWWIHLVIQSLKGKRGKYKHDTRARLLKQRGDWMKHTYPYTTTHIVKDSYSFKGLSLFVTIFYIVGKYWRHQNYEITHMDSSDQRTHVITKEVWNKLK